MVSYVRNGATTFSIMTLGVMSIFSTLSMSDTQHNSVIMLSVVMLSVVMLSVVAPKKQIEFFSFKSKVNKGQSF
jgi:hypothetical protein